MKEVVRQFHKTERPLQSGKNQKETPTQVYYKKGSSDYLTAKFINVEKQSPVSIGKCLCPKTTQPEP